MSGRYLCFNFELFIRRVRDNRTTSRAVCGTLLYCCAVAIVATAAVVVVSIGFIILCVYLCVCVCVCVRVSVVGTAAVFL